MDKTKKGMSIGTKIYLFVGITVFMAAMIVALISYWINANRIDEYFKGLSLDTARNFSALVDAKFLKELRESVESEEYQAIRKKAEENDDEKLIEEYLKEKGLWDRYNETRSMLIEYLHNMEDVKYLYIIAWGDKDALYDMYLIDDENNPMYSSTGYYEEREEAFLGMEAKDEVAPTISDGDWGWLCSSYVPVYTDDGTLVCQIGCDVGMDDIMKERNNNLLYMMIGAICITGVMIAGAMILFRRTIIRPLNQITKEMKNFSPSQDLDYEKSGIINLDIKSNDEINDIYSEIRSMQIRILDYLKDITSIQKEKEKAESDVKKKNKEIGQISKEAYRDSLTCVGSKVAYVKKTEEMNSEIGKQLNEFAIVMVDVNFLKIINDEHGHTAGDMYLKGCCSVICRIYKHSPVYRVGGDEFVVILTGEDYKAREERLAEMRTSFEDSYKQTEVSPWQRYSAASGMSEYKDGDNDVETVFERADKEMYNEKVRFKKANGIDPTSR